MKKKNLILATALLGLLGACSDRPTAVPVDGVTVIDVEAALKNVEGEIKLSDLYSSVRYVPLETTDSSLVGGYASATFTDKDILVSSYLNSQCFRFDKQTGKFINTIGHRGEDPKGTSTCDVIYNERDGMAYFIRQPDRLQRYDLQGNYQGLVRVPGYFPMPSQYLFTDSAVVGKYSKGFPLVNDVVMQVYTYDGQCTDTIHDPMVAYGYDTNAPMGYTELETLPGGGLLAITDFRDGTFWNTYNSGVQAYLYDNQVKYLRNFSDTVHVVRDGRLQPSIIFHTGRRHFPVEARCKDYGVDDKVVITKVTESPERIEFVCVQDLYDKRNGYYGIYDRESGQTTMKAYNVDLEDDLTGFMPYRGPLASIERIMDWLDEHPEAKENPALAPLLELDPEANPVAIVLEPKQ